MTVSLIPLLRRSLGISGQLWSLVRDWSDLGRALLFTVRFTFFDHVDESHLRLDITCVVDHLLPSVVGARHSVRVGFAAEVVDDLVLHALHVNSSTRLELLDGHLVLRTEVIDYLVGCLLCIIAVLAGHSHKTACFTDCVGSARSTNIE